MTWCAFESPVNNIQLNNALFLGQTGLPKRISESSGGGHVQQCSMHNEVKCALELVFLVTGLTDLPRH